VLFCLGVRFVGEKDFAAVASQTDVLTGVYEGE
jgi:hypothetical protein